MSASEHADSGSVERIAAHPHSRSWTGATTGVNSSEFKRVEPLHCSHSSSSSSISLPSMITYNVPWKNPRKRQRGDTAWVGIRIEEQHGEWNPDCVLPFTLSTVCYPAEDFEDPDHTGRIPNAKMVSKSWESLDAKFTARLSRSVTDITLFFGTMRATCDQILWDAHTE